MALLSANRNGMVYPLDLFFSVLVVIYYMNRRLFTLFSDIMGAGIPLMVDILMYAFMVW